MDKTTCCVCFKRNATIPLSADDSNRETIASKLRKVVSEVLWKDNFTICHQCVRTLDVVIEFRNTCIRSSSIRVDQEESDSNENGSEQPEVYSNEGIEDLPEKDTQKIPEQTISVKSGIVLDPNDHLYQHDIEIPHSQHPYETNSLSVLNNEDTTNDRTETEYFCDRCNDSFSSKSKYEDHVKEHNDLICFHCNKPFKSKLMLAKHIKTQHITQKTQPEESKDCNSKVNHSESIQYAKTTLSCKMDKMYKCNKCEKFYKAEKVMRKHLITCDGIKRHSAFSLKKDYVKNECDKCGRFYTTEKNLKAHTKQCRKNLERCHMCDVILNDPKEKFEHVLKEHNINLEIGNTCQYCYQQFLSDNSLQSHIVEKHENSRTKKNYVERSYSCEVCCKVFGYVKEVIQHCVKEHQMDPKSVKPYLCEKCSTRFTSSANIIQHKQYHEGERSHICSYCGKSFITKSDLTVHEYTHLNRRNYKCEICERAFNTNKNLRSHILVVHTDSSLWKYQCKLCDKKFPLKSGFDQHLKRHAGDKQFKCLVCEKSFVSNSELSKHKTFHSDERAFKCSHCSKDYKNRRVYEVHLTKVHGIGNAKIPVRTRKFACHICPRTFFDKQKLSRHMCTHTGIKPFFCSICEKRFSDKSYLKQHLKIVHNLLDVQNNELKIFQVVQAT